MRIQKDLDSGLEGRHVIIVEDIVDQLTLTYLRDILKARAPRALRRRASSQPSETVVDVASINRLPSEDLVVGYGLALRGSIATCAYHGHDAL